MNEHTKPTPFRARRILVVVVFALGAALLLARAVQLQVVDKDFLQYQGDSRYLRVVEIPAHRGTIMDRNGEPLAMSTPVDSVWANPQELSGAREYLPRLAKVLGLDVDYVRRALAKRGDREFVYLKRHIDPALAERVSALGVPGVFLQREYRRYYPTAEVFSHVVGFTNIDDVGQEGLELAFDQWLRGEPGSKRVIRDGRGRVVEEVESIRAPRPGRALALSLDRRVQYLAYRELKAAVLSHKARSGSVVVLDAASGEILAMVNQPAYNPNTRKQIQGGRYRNRAVTDVFEPGSTIKPFTVAAALESGQYSPDTPIDTAPGFFRVGQNTIQDIRNYGLIDVTTVIRKSSNVGASKIALSMEPRQLWSVLDRVGFGRIAGSGFPGEVGGLLTHYRRWREIEQATMAFGYGLSVTPLQLARAYAVFATGGLSRTPSFQPVENPGEGERLLNPETALQVRAMLEQVVSERGTARRAEVPGYRVAGKTGTVKKSEAGGYAEDRYVAVFAGMAPASRPRLVMVVMINEPHNGEYYGGQVAAPVFAKIMAGSLRLLDVPPDDLPLMQTALPDAGDRG